MFWGYRLYVYIIPHIRKQIMNEVHANCKALLQIMTLVILFIVPYNRLD